MSIMAEALLMISLGRETLRNCQNRGIGLEDWTW